MKILNGPELFRELSERIPKAKTRVLMAVAFWGSGAENKIGLEIINNQIDIKFVCDLMSGGTNPNVIDKLKKKFRGSFKKHDSLHAKIYIVDDFCVIGSSNVSANGLSFQGDEVEKLIECNAVIKNDKIQEIVDFFYKIYNKSEEITKKDIDKSKELYKARRRSNAENKTPSKPIEFISNLVETNSKICIYKREVSENAKEELKEKKIKLKRSDLDVAEGWKFTPKDRVLWFKKTERGLKYEGIWRTLGVKNQKNDIQVIERDSELKNIPKNEYKKLSIIIDRLGLELEEKHEINEQLLSKIRK